MDLGITLFCGAAVASEFMLQEINQLKHAETGSCLGGFMYEAAELMPSTPATQDCTDDTAPSIYDIHVPFQQQKKPAQPNG